MTWPLTFSSPPSSVEFHLLNEVVGTLTAGARAKEEVARGSYCQQESVLLLLLLLLLLLQLQLQLLPTAVQGG